MGSLSLSNGKVWSNPMHHRPFPCVFFPTVLVIGSGVVGVPDVDIE